MQGRMELSPVQQMATFQLISRSLPRLRSMELLSSPISTLRTRSAPCQTVWGSTGAQPWRGQEPSWHAFEWFDGRWLCSRCLVVRLAGLIGDRGRAARYPGPHAQAHEKLGTSCLWHGSQHRCCYVHDVVRTSVPRRLLLQYPDHRERQAAVRLRRICGRRHPTRPSQIDVTVGFTFFIRDDSPPPVDPVARVPQGEDLRRPPCSLPHRREYGL